MNFRDYEKECRDLPGAPYAYDFDDRMRDYLWRTFEPFVKKGAALELGCYQGDFTRRILQFFERVTVIDASLSSVNTVLNRFDERVTPLCSTFETTRFSTRFDSIFIVHVLEHVDDPRVLLKLIKTWLKPGGRVFLAVPNAHAPSRQIAVEMGLISTPTSVTETEALHGHLRTYDLRALYEEVQSTGLSIIHGGGVFFKPFANFQFDRMVKEQILSESYLEGCYHLGNRYPDLSASIFVVAEG